MAREDNPISHGLASAPWTTPLAANRQAGQSIGPKTPSGIDVLGASDSCINTANQRGVGAVCGHFERPLRSCTSQSGVEWRPDGSPFPKTILSSDDVFAGPAAIDLER
jgi:hypothetical protein